MTDQPPDPNDDAGVRTTVDRPPSTPRWVKVFGVIVIVVVLLFVVVMMVAGGGGEHGPGRHAPSADAGGGQAVSSGATTGDHAPWEGARG